MGKPGMRSDGYKQINMLAWMYTSMGSTKAAVLPEPVSAGSVERAAKSELVCSGVARSQLQHLHQVLTPCRAATAEQTHTLLVPCDNSFTCDTDDVPELQAKRDGGHLNGRRLLVARPIDSL